MAASKFQPGAPYQIEVVRSGSWWAISVPELDSVFTQARRLDQVEDTVRDAMALLFEIDESDIGDLVLEITPPSGTDELLQTLEKSVAVASEATQAAAAARRQAAETLRDLGLPLRDVGRLIGLSHQRVSQLLAGEHDRGQQQTQRTR